MFTDVVAKPGRAIAAAGAPTATTKATAAAINIFFIDFSPFFQKLRVTLNGQRTGTCLCSGGDTWPRHAAAAAKPAKQHKSRITLY
jgi:hypothetical protein